MADDAARLGPIEFQPQDEIDEVFSRANPNPSRAGCPSHDALAAAASKKLPIGDPTYEHLAKCSPCYREFRRLQQAAQQSSRQPLFGRTGWFAAAAALVLIAGGVVWLLHSVAIRSKQSVTSAPRSMAAAAQPLQLDLRNYSISRTDEQASKQPPVRLVRGTLNLTILLPVGSEPGPYDAQLLDSSLRSLASTNGQARVEDFVTTLRTKMDLRSVPSGTYQLALRHDGDDWHLFPALVR